MSADAVAGGAVAYGRRARSIWVIIGLCTTLFCMVCSAGAYGAYGYVRGVTESQHATLERIRGQQLLVLRHLHRDYEAVEKESSTVINEGDEVTTGADTEANMVLFDQSTVHLYFGTKLELTTLRASRFVGTEESARLTLEQGTVVLSTASSEVSAYNAANYVVSIPDGEIDVRPNSTVRVLIAGIGDERTSQVVVTFGSATAVGRGKQVELQPGQMSVFVPNGQPGDARQAEQELIRNGDFQEPPTSGKETKDGGGLGVSAWQPIFEQSGDSPADSVPLTQSVSVVTETLPGQNITAVSLNRSVGDGNYARVGIRQDINVPVSFYRYMGLKAAVKLASQTDPVGGPQGDVFPLTINVIYTDSDGHQQSWKRSFYWGAANVDPTHAVNLSVLGAWQTIGSDSSGQAQQQSDGASQFVLKQTDTGLGQDISVINAIEIYAIGDRFQSWVTDLSLVAR